MVDFLARNEVPGFEVTTRALPGQQSMRTTGHEVYGPQHSYIALLDILPIAKQEYRARVLSMPKFKT